VPVCARAERARGTPAGRADPAGEVRAAYPARVVAAEVMDGAVVRRWCRLAAEAAGPRTRSAIDALERVIRPDADTGTNLYRTLRSGGAGGGRAARGRRALAVWRAAADGAMHGACGNSGSS